MSTEAEREELPMLAPGEHAMLERYVGRPLSNEEAQILLREVTIIAAFNAWISGKAPYEPR